MRLILGLIKGLIIGGLVGVGAYAAGKAGGWHWVTYGAAGFAVGMLAGRPFWSHMVDKDSTIVVAILKGIVGYGFGVGVYALVSWLGGEWMVPFEFQGEQRVLHNWQPLLAGGIGAVYGAWVELDDAPKKTPPQLPQKTA